MNNMKCRKFYLDKYVFVEVDFEHMSGLKQTYYFPDDRTADEFIEYCKNRRIYNYE